MISRTKTGLAFVGAMLLVLASVGSASAQGRRGGGFGMMGRGGGGLMLLNNQSVQQELKMTQPQIEKVATKQQELQQSMRELFQSGQSDPSGRQAMMQKMQDMQQKAVADILDNVQLKRYKQVQLQIEGPAAIARKDVADQLNLTDAQKEQVKSIQQAQRTEMRSMMQGADFRNMSPGDRQAMMEKMQTLQKSYGEKYAAVLTGTQKAQWRHMTGAPFKLVMPAAGQQQS